uniref:Putative secreted protein synganglion overexpressed n=1 Tax=Rhipicephalus microplus TaxID=6941 RepID=A0A6M2DA64_RHIMP
MTGKCVLSAFILFAVLATTNSTENPCEGIIHEECINKETWCLVDANGRRGLSCRDAHCHPDEVDADWNVCKIDGSELTCYKNPDGGQCICVCS